MKKFQILYVHKLNSPEDGVLFPNVLWISGIKAWMMELKLQEIQTFSYSWSIIIREYHAAATAKSIQSCPTLYDPIDSSPPGSPVPGILQARTLEWVAISVSNAQKWKVKVKSLSRVQLLATPWTSAHQAPPSMGFSRQEYQSRVSSPSPREHHRVWKITGLHTTEGREIKEGLAYDFHTKECSWVERQPNRM